MGVYSIYTPFRSWLVGWLGWLGPCIKGVRRKHDNVYIYERSPSDASLHVGTNAECRMDAGTHQWIK